MRNANYQKNYQQGCRLQMDRQLFCVIGTISCFLSVLLKLANDPSEKFNRIICEHFNKKD